MNGLLIPYVRRNFFYPIPFYKYIPRNSIFTGKCSIPKKKKYLNDNLNKKNFFKKRKKWYLKIYNKDLIDKNKKIKNSYLSAPIFSELFFYYPITL